MENNNMECPICNGSLKRGKHAYTYNEIKLGIFEADQCTKCNELFFTEQSSDEIDKRAKEIGIWGMGKEGIIGTSGNSLIVRVPKEIGEFLGFKPGKKVFIHPEGKNKLIVENTR